jgi:CheY-like chemotaxis protein
MASRLLLVDNDRSFLKEHQVSLEAAFDVDVLSAPESAISKLEAGGYTAVLICVEVADNKGYALCSAVRKSPKLADMKVALISAKATEEEYKRHQSLKGKADLYLHKPITPTALVEALGTLVPPKAVDPDNPLGDLSDLGAGDDWLDSLKTDLSEDLASPPSPAPTTMPAAAPVPTGAPAKTMAISADILREITGGVPMAKAAEPNPSATGPLQIPVMPPAPSGPDPRVAELENQVAETLAKLADAQRQATALESHLKDMEKAVADRDSAIADRDKALQERDGLIQERDRHIQDRDAKLADREAALARVQSDFDSLKSTHDSVTRNLDELEKRQAEAAALQGRLEAAEAAVRRFEENAAKENPEGLKAQLREAMTERQELLQQVESLNAQLGEKTQRVVDLIKDRDKHQQAALNLETKAEELEALKGAHAAMEKDLAEARERIAALEKTKGDLEAVKAELLKGKEDLQKALDEARAAHAKALEEAQAEHGKALEAAKAVADAAEERARTLKGEVAGLEATMKGQGRDLVEMGGRLADKEKEVEGLRQGSAAKDAELAEATTRIKALEDDLRALRNQHEALQATQAGLEKEKDALASRLAAHGDHVVAVHGLMDELEGLLAKRKTLPKP